MSVKVLGLSGMGGFGGLLGASRRVGRCLEGWRGGLILKERSVVSKRSGL